MHIEAKGYIVEMDGTIWGTAATEFGAWADASKEGMPTHGEGRDTAQCWPATNRLLAMVMLHGGGVSWTICDGIACYPDEGK